MTRRAITSTAFLLVAVLARSTPARQDRPLDFVCSAFPPAFAEADVIERFGRQNVTNAEVFGSDDGPQPATVVFANDENARLEIVWWDHALKSRPNWIRIRGDRSRWRMANGITLGDDLLTLERSNGRPFRLSGFANEISGRVRSWAGGRLEIENSEECSIDIRMFPASEVDRGLALQVTTGTNYSSGHPAMQKLNPRVREIYLRRGWRP